jgi:hypothetical protein
VVPGQVLYLYVGGTGATGTNSSGEVSGGFNGGGRSGWNAGGGGGATDIRIGGVALTNRVVVAGGGGGAAAGAVNNTTAYGGVGGGLVAGNGSNPILGNRAIGGGGTQNAGGTAGAWNVYSGGPGATGVGGYGSDVGGSGGGGGGGGWYGGGGGAEGGGGGGSSYSQALSVQNLVHTQGYRSGNGTLVIYYNTACAASSRQPVVLPIAATPSISITADKDTTCRTVQLTASGGVSYLWSILSPIQTAKLATGLHRLNNSYTGPAIQLRRPSDNAVQDFYFANGQLDIIAIAFFLNGENGRCAKLYDQSGNGFHFTQTDVNLQPLFVASGINGKPVLRFTASPQTYMTSPVVVSAPYTIVYSAKQTGPVRGRMLSSVNNNWLLGWHGGKKQVAYFDGEVNMTGTVADNNTYVYAATRSGNTTRVFENGSLLYNTSNGAGGINKLQMNGYQGTGTELSDGDFGDIILYDAAISDEARAEMEQQTSGYYGLPSAIAMATLTQNVTGPTATFTVTGTGANGCTATVSKTIVVDGKPPLVQCPANQQLILSPACTATLPDYRSMLTVSDNCTPTNALVITQTPAAGTTISGVNAVLVQFTIRDSASYQSTCSITVTPRDTTTLRIVCPAAQTVTQSVSACGAVVSFSAPTAGYCRPVTIQQTTGFSNGSLFPVGSSTVTYTISDGLGNSAVCSTSVNVVPLIYSVTVSDSVCAGGTSLVALSNVAPGGIVRWYTAPNGDGTLAATGNPVTLGVGVYYARYSAPCSVIESEARVYNISNIPVSFAGDSILCPGTRGVIDASGVGNFQWSPLKLPVTAATAASKMAAGLRLLNSNYTGSLVLLRRSSDNVQQAFGATGGHLDTMAIKTWLGGASAYCVTLYDQSGNSNHFTQATASAQPLLVLNNSINNRPALRFTTAQYMQLNISFPAPFTISVAARQTGGTRARVLSSVSNNWLLGWHQGFQARAYFEGWVNQPTTVADNNVQLYTGTSTGSTSALYENGIKLVSGTTGLAGPQGLQLNGYLGASERSDCEIMEVLAFNTVLTDMEQADVEAGTYAYYINSKKLLVAASMTTRSFTATAIHPVCATTQSAAVTVRSAAQGSPSQFGQNTWNVYVWEPGASSINTVNWNEGYAGYYASTEASINTVGQWAGTTPSSASGYQGCAVTAAKHSWIARRKGFPCAFYRIDVGSHGAAQLYINGIKVWEHDACCDSHTGVWTGSLGSADSVEYRTTRFSSTTATNISFNTLTPWLSYAATNICGNTTNLAPTVNITGGTFSATPAGLTINATTGVVTAGNAGNYQISYTLAGGCSAAQSVSASMKFTMPVGDSSVYGTDGWNVYVWNIAGPEYRGYYSAGGLNINSADQWASGTAPSNATGYQGCTVSTSGFNWIAKRKGFTCGRYRIDVPYHKDGGQLWINGVRVWIHSVCCDAHTGIWTGVLGPNDKLEFRISQSTTSGGAQLNIVEIPFTSNIDYGVSTTCTSATPITAIVSQTGGIFSSTPAGLSINTTTGTISPALSSVGDYTIYYSWTSPCGNTLNTSTNIQVSASAGDPVMFGLNEWNVYVWNSGGSTLNANPWVTNYSGYYVATGTDFNTENQWVNGTSPSTATGYQGCAVPATYISWSAKRQGFPCGYYLLDIPAHDDASQLWINGVKVWEHDACCDAHTAVWQGMLGPDDKVEFRTTQGGGGSQGSMNLRLGNPTISFGNAVICSSAGLQTPAGVLAGGVFTATPAGLSIDAATGVVNPLLSAGGAYTISWIYYSACTDPLRSTVTVTIQVPPGDPTVSGTNLWNIYLWNAGDNDDRDHSWNTAYSGFAPGNSTLSQNYNFLSTANPSLLSGYQGCSVTGTKFSWTAVRKQFPCGRYALRMPLLTGSAELRVNDILVRSFEQTTPTAIIWQGYLSVNDKVEIRARSISGAGSRLQFTFTNIGESMTLSYLHRGCFMAGNMETVTPLVDGYNGGTFSAAPSGLSIDAGTGVIDLSNSAAGNYTVTWSGSSVCGTSYSLTAPVVVSANAGNPLVFGQNEWNVYAWNAGLSSGVAWSTGYAGYYVDTTLHFNTQDRWNAAQSPSSATGYTGCSVDNEDHSWSAKRQGFPCGYYQLNIPGHDDNTELWVNGVRVFYHIGCCDLHNAVWTGMLGPQDKVEFRCADNVSSSSGAIQFIALTPTATVQYPGTSFCSGLDHATPVVTGISGGSFSASAGLSIDGNTGTIYPSLSVPGTYTIRYEMSGASGCAGYSVFIQVTIESAPTASFIYGTGPYCTSLSNVSPQFTGAGGGVFSSAAGLSLNTASGVLDPSTSVAGTYLINYTLAGTGGCPPVTASASVSITAAPSAAFHYAENSFCNTGSAVLPQITGTTGGTFSSTAGLVLNGNTGAIIAAASAPGMYVVSYTIAAANGCGAVTSSVTTTITEAPWAGIAYSGSPYCGGAGIAAVSHTGTTGGTYAAGDGLALDGQTGAIDLAASVAGIYTVTYTIAAGGGCGQYRISTTVIVRGSFAASIQYSGSPYCGSSGLVLVSQTGSTGGVYSSTAGLAINAQTGSIDLNASLTGIYTVTYSPPANACGTAATTQVSVRPATFIDPQPNQVVCATSPTQVVSFTTTPGVAISWSNDNPAIGLPATGLGDIASFVAQNGAAIPLVANIAVTASGGTDCKLLKRMIFRITVKPMPALMTISDQALCSGFTTTPVSFTSQVAGAYVSWTNSNTAIGLAAAGTGNIAAFISQAGNGVLQSTVTATPIAEGCVGLPVNYNYTVAPSAGQISYPQSGYCNQGWAYVTRTGSAGGIFSAAPAGLQLDVASGAINLALSASGTYTITYTLAAAGAGCSNSSTTQLTLGGVAAANPVPNLVLCNGAVAPAWPFSGATSFSWTSSNSTIGLPASGTGTGLPSFTAINTSAVPVYATIYVTPLAGSSAGCPGRTITFRITVNPTPSADIAGDQVYCRGINTVPTQFSGPVAGTTYNWTSNSTGTGLALTRGVNTVPSFVTANPGSGTASSVISVTPVANKCTGPLMIFQYQVGNCITEAGDAGGSSDNLRMAAGNMSMKTNFAKQVVIGPNPTSGNLTIYTGKSGQFLLRLLNQYGQLLQKSISFTGNLYTLNLAGYASGTYLVELFEVGSSIIVKRKIVKL